MVAAFLNGYFLEQVTLFMSVTQLLYSHHCDKAFVSVLFVTAFPCNEDPKLSGHGEQEQKCFCSGTSPPWVHKTRHLNSYHGNCCTGFLMLQFQPIVFWCSHLRIVLWRSHPQCTIWLLCSVFSLSTYTSGIDLIAFLILSSLCPPFQEIRCRPKTLNEYRYCEMRDVLHLLCTPVQIWTKQR